MNTVILIGLFILLVYTVWKTAYKSGKEKAKNEFLKSAEELAKKHNEKLHEIAADFTGPHKPSDVLSGSISGETAGAPDIPKDSG